MNVLMKLSATSDKLDDPIAVVQLTALKADESWKVQDNMTITVALSGKYIRNAFSVKQACSLLNVFLRPRDRLYWLSRKELDLFLQFFNQYMIFRIAKYSVVLPAVLPSLKGYVPLDASTDLKEVAEQLEKTVPYTCLRHTAM